MKLLIRQLSLCILLLLLQCKIRSMLGLVLLVLERLLLLQSHLLGFTVHVLHLLFRFQGDSSRPLISVGR